MGKITNGLARFFYGRYGNDTLNKFLMVLYLICIVAMTVLSLFIQSPLFNLIGWMVSLSIFIWSFYRTMSRNIYKRRRENERFCGFFKLRRNKFRDRKTHVYRKCPKCKAVLRLPKAKGKHFVNCPRCKNRFSVGR